VKIRFAIGFLLVCVSPSVLPADQITLTNGDRVTGSIIKKDGSMLVIDSAGFGKITASWNQVASITSDAPVFAVIGAETIQGTLSTANGQVQIAPANGGARTVNLSDISALRNSAEQSAYDRLQDPGLTELWTGTGNLGWAGTAGNARTTTLALAATAARATRTDKTTLHFNAVTASALVGTIKTSTARAMRGGWAYQRDIRPKVFGNVFNDYEYDRFQALNLRFVLGSGAGYHAINTERSKLDLLAGADYNRENFSTPLTRNSAEFFWGDDFNHKLNNSVTIVQAYRMFNSLTDSPDFRVNFDLGAVTRLAAWLSWNVSLSDRYLRTPVPGRLSNDVLYSTGLGVTFGGRP
jgi:putative salt-induced outer membrane protein YdiY